MIQRLKATVTRFWGEGADNQPKGIRQIPSLVSLYVQQARKNGWTDVLVGGETDFYHCRCPLSVLIATLNA